MGNARARIFCSRNEAELISIDGYYQTADEMARTVVHGVRAYPRGTVR
jgi:septum site-determining protein MinC